MSMEIKVKKHKFTLSERKLENLEYKTYLYEKYKPTFSSTSLRFNYQGQEYQLAELMEKLHASEQEKINLNFSVTALFLFLLCFGYWGVVALDAYVQSVR